MGIEDEFLAASEEAKALPTSITNDMKLKLYALYKQGTHGDCDTARPGMLDFAGKAKWDAWNGLKGKLSQEEAMAAYVSYVAELKSAL